MKCRNSWCYICVRQVKIFAVRNVCLTLFSVYILPRGHVQKNRCCDVSFVFRFFVFLLDSHVFWISLLSVLLWCFLHHAHVYSLPWCDLKHQIPGAMSKECYDEMDVLLHGYVSVSDAAFESHPSPSAYWNHIWDPQQTSVTNKTQQSKNHAVSIVVKHAFCFVRFSSINGQMSIQEDLRIWSVPILSPSEFLDQSLLLNCISDTEALPKAISCNGNSLLAPLEGSESSC